MESAAKTCNDLTSFLLGPIRSKPGMYLGENKLSKLQNFLFGYGLSYSMACDGVKDDPYFGENGFIKWFCKNYDVELGSSWETPFLEEANNNEREALNIYFKYLEEYAAAQQWE